MEVIKAENLTTKYYWDFLGVDDILFFVNRGEIFGFIGPNGAGKTTTIRMLTGILNPSSGRIEVFSMDMKNYKLRFARERASCRRWQIRTLI